MRIESMRKGILLERIHLQVFEGEIVHCVFDNLQEKNAFLNILRGRELADYQKIYYDEVRILEENIQQIFREKIAVITKVSNLIDSVTIAENIFLVGSLVSEHWLNHKKFKQKTYELFQEFGVNIDVKTPVKKLSVFEKVQIELLKAYLNHKKVLVLTELCNLFSDTERKGLMELLKKLQKQGISCIILEPLEDIDFSAVDSVVIIRRGKTVLSKGKDECDYTMLYKALYYDELKKRKREKIMLSSATENDRVIKIEGITSAYLKGINIEVRKGEILKVFCIDEKSYNELTDIFKGNACLLNGFVTSGKKTGQSNSFQGLENGIGIVEGHPATATLFEELTVMDNLKMLLAKKIKNVWLIPKYKKSIKLILKDVISRAMFRKKVKELSPADVQKVLYSKWLLYSPDILVCIQPFAEGNMEAREMARKMIYMLKERRIPVVIVTSNSAEFNYCIGREVYIQHGENIAKEKAYRILYNELAQ